MTPQRIFVLIILAVALAACNQGAPANPTAASQPTIAPQSSSAALPAVAPTVAPSPTSAPTVAPTKVQANVLPSGDLSDNEILKIFTSSFARYPWRMKQTVLTKSSNVSITGLVEAQSKTQAHTVMNQPIGATTAAIETIVISPTIYARFTGLAPAQLKAIGVTDGQWTKTISPDVKAMVTDLALSSADPVQLLKNLGFQELMAKANADPKGYKLVGNEKVNGIATNIYEIKLGTVTYRTSVGLDGRIYKMVSESSLRTATTIVEYDPSIKIAPPIP